MLDRNDSTQNLYDLSITEAKQGTKGMKKSFYIEIRDDRLYHIRQSSAVRWENVEASEQKIGELFEKHGIERWASLRFICHLRGRKISKSNDRKSKDNKSKDTNVKQNSNSKQGCSKTVLGLGVAATAAVVAGLYYFWPSSNEGNSLGSQSPTITLVPFFVLCSRYSVVISSTIISPDLKQKRILLLETRLSMHLKKRVVPLGKVRNRQSVKKRVRRRAAFYSWSVSWLLLQLWSI